MPRALDWPEQAKTLAEFKILGHQLHRDMDQKELAPVLAFGWKPDVVGNGAILADDKIIYVASRLIIIQNTQTHVQEMCEITDNAYATAMALAPHKRQVAVAEIVGDQRPQVEIFSIPFLKRVLLKAEILQAKRITSLSFSSDSRLLAGIFTSGTPSVAVWYLDKERPRLSAFLTMKPEYGPLSDICFHHQLTSQLAVVGNGHAFSMTYISSEEDVDKGDTKATTFHYAGTLEISREVNLPVFDAITACFSPVSNQIIVGRSNGQIVQEDLENPSASVKLLSQTTNINVQKDKESIVCVRASPRGVVGIDTAHNVKTIMMDTNTLVLGNCMVYSLNDTKLFPDIKVTPARTGTLPLSVFPTHIPSNNTVIVNEDNANNTNGKETDNQKEQQNDDQEGGEVDEQGKKTHINNLFPSTNLPAQVFASTFLAGGTSGGIGAGNANQLLQTTGSNDQNPNNQISGGQTGTAPTAVIGQSSGSSTQAGATNASKTLTHKFEGILQAHAEILTSDFQPRCAGNVSFSKNGETFIVGGGGLGRLIEMQWLPNQKRPPEVPPAKKVDAKTYAGRFVLGKRLFI
ncbi:MAG: hypothetical protein EZS28_022014 [Streblomastix strix]|uniref:Uncharacterized protein n=1 Tax=Streblomastix strix TaxID=222440 RepID=A0A5J4VII8_9EUKA|nr:MAG: hypothetical protein EZS28_022014 [Streblomastix strix]